MAIEKGVNILTEGTFRDKQGYLAIIEKLMKRDYKVELNFMAVDGMESMLSAMERFYQMLELGLPLRNVERKYHEQAYLGMLDTLKTVEEKGMFSRVRVFTRGKEEREPNLIYSNENVNPSQTAVQAIEEARRKEQERMLQNPSEIQRRIDTIKSKIETNGKKWKIESQKQQLLELEQEFKQLLEKEQMKQEQR